MRILNLSHGHPEDSIGGAEIGSYAIHRELRRRQGVGSFYLARDLSPSPAHPHTPFMARSGTSDEGMFRCREFDYFLMSNRDSYHGLSQYAEFLDQLRPDVIHFHHYAGLGLELIRVTRNVLPDSVIYLSLYEYLAICYQKGQMVKTYDDSLCSQATPAACSRCFPDRSRGDFFVRERFIRSHLQLADRYLPSSRFLEQRYLDWGLPPEKMMVLDNGFQRVPAQPPRRLGPRDGRGRVAYFGQINPFKGVLVLLEAFRDLVDGYSCPDWITLDIYGANLDLQEESFRDEFEDLLERTPRAEFHGSYRPDQQAGLMAEIDWVVVPSTWWENSPLVIQEAAIAGRPVICSDIGGMAEKVRHGHNGLLAAANNSRALSRTLREAALTDGLWERCAANLEPGPWIDEVVDQLLGDYRESLSSRSGKPESRSTNSGRSLG